MFIQIVHYLFMAYTIMLFARILGSWLPQFQMHPIFRFVAYYTDPYLNIFRKFISPIGGTLDISPILAFFALNFLESFILRLIS